MMMMSHQNYGTPMTPTASYLDVKLHNSPVSSATSPLKLLLPRLTLESNASFLRIGGGHNMEKMTHVAMIFNEVLEPLYGSQAKAIKQIEDSTDRACFLLYENDSYSKPVAVLVFKTNTSDEFEEIGVRNSIEIKSLFVYRPNENSGKGYATMLVDKLKRELHHQMESGIIDGIHVTVSEKVQESLVFFSKKDFAIVHTWDGRYLDGIKEHLLFYERPSNREPSSPMIEMP